MKKKAKYAFVAVFITFSGYWLCANQEPNAMPDLILANIEAMALDEVDVDCNDCYNLPATCKDWGWGGCKGAYFHRG